MQPVLLGENVKGEEKNGNMLKKKKEKKHRVKFEGKCQ